MTSSATINIGGAEHALYNVTSGWIKDQFGSRHASTGNVCVRISIHDDGVNIGLATPACASGGGGGRVPNEKEERVLELWRKHKLDTNEFNTGQLVAFVEQVKHL